MTYRIITINDIFNNLWFVTDAQGVEAGSRLQLAGSSVTLKSALGKASPAPAPGTRTQASAEKLNLSTSLTNLRPSPPPSTNWDNDR